MPHVTKRVRTHRIDDAVIQLPPIPKRCDHYAFIYVCGYLRHGLERATVIDNLGTRPINQASIQGVCRMNHDKLFALTLNLALNVSVGRIDKAVALGRENIQGVFPGQLWVG